MTTATKTWKTLVPERGALARLDPGDSDIWAERLRFDRERPLRLDSAWATYGCVLFDAGVMREAAAFVAEHDAWPDLAGQVERLEQARLAEGLRRSIRERPGFDELRASLADARAITRATADRRPPRVKSCATRPALSASQG